MRLLTLVINDRAADAQYVNDRAPQPVPELIIADAVIILGVVMQVWEAQPQVPTGSMQGTSRLT
jgi:hypothetical protein